MTTMASKKTHEKKTMKSTKKTHSKQPTRSPQGQDGPPPDLESRPLNAKEKSLLFALDLMPDHLPMTLHELADVFSRSNPKKRRYSWARNSVRRLVRAKLVRRVDDGTYSRTTKEVRKEWLG